VERDIKIPLLIRGSMILLLAVSVGSTAGTNLAVAASDGLEESAFDT
jgi:hypothetical protein